MIFQIELTQRYTANGKNSKKLDDVGRSLGADGGGPTTKESRGSGMVRKRTQLRWEDGCGGGEKSGGKKAAVKEQWERTMAKSMQQYKNLSALQWEI